MSTYYLASDIDSFLTEYGSCIYLAAAMVARYDEFQSQQLLNLLGTLDVLKTAAQDGKSFSQQDILDDIVLNPGNYGFPSDANAGNRGVYMQMERVARERSNSPSIIRAVINSTYWEYSEDKGYHVEKQHSFGAIYTVCMKLWEWAEFHSANPSRLETKSDAIHRLLNEPTEHTSLQHFVVISTEASQQSALLRSLQKSLKMPSMPALPANASLEDAHLALVDAVRHQLWAAEQVLRGMAQSPDMQAFVPSINVSAQPVNSK